MSHPLVNDLSSGTFQLLGQGARDLFCFQKTRDIPKKGWYYVLQNVSANHCNKLINSANFILTYIDDSITAFNNISSKVNIF